jgi:cytochrome c551/c552
MSKPSSHRPLMPRVIFVAVIVAIGCAVQLPRLMRSSAAAGPAVAPGGLVPGLTLTFTSADGKTVDARDARLVSLMVPAGTPPSAMLAPGRFTATWTGMVRSKIHDDYTFGALGRGDLVVTLNDVKVLELHGDFANHPSPAFSIHKGKTRLVVTYTAPAEGDAWVRLLWAPPDKILDPVPPDYFLHDTAEDVLAKHQAMRVGRDILVTMRCSACHQGITGSVAELKQDAPNLTGIGDRLTRTYVANWVTNPRAMRPGTSMPRVFDDAPATSQPSVDTRAADVAAFLCPTAPAATPGVTDTAVLAKGARLFTNLGCIACHVAPGIDDSDPSLKRVPLKYVRAQFVPGGLATFLKQPEAHYAWSKMPNFHLSDDEAAALSAWLVSRCAPDALPDAPAGDPERGKALFASAGCLSCHNANGFKTPPPTAPDLTAADWSRGCGGNGPKGVDYGFTDEQKAGLKAMGAADWKPSLARDPGPEFAARQIAVLRCTGCHSMDGQDNVWRNMDDEIAAIVKDLPPRPVDDPELKGDQSRPPLTWIGEKLRPSWTGTFIAGKLPYKPRPWLFARMPSFPARAVGLATGTALTHGCPAADEPVVPADPKLADIGQTLTGQGRFGCVKCHSVGDQAALAPFEGNVAPNFAHVTDRLRHDYYMRWMNNPTYFVPGTKMIGFADAHGKTAYTDVLNGDAAAEFNAIWNYLLAGKDIVPVQ